MNLFKVISKLKLILLFDSFLINIIFIKEYFKFLIFNFKNH